MPTLTIRAAPLRIVFGLLAALVLLAHASIIRATEPEWTKLNTEALEYFRAYLRFDTSNPPGNTSDAIAYLKQILDKEGIEAATFESKPGVVSLVARLPGPPGTKPLMLMSHADVVPARADEWSHPPFGADIADGYVWGRGAMDDKSNGIMALMTMLALKRQDIALRRGVTMMVNADEEAGGEFGARFMVEKHWDAIDPAFVINEGGEGTPGWLGSKGVTFKVAVAEKRVLWLRLTAKGRAGHGSMPHDDNPNLILLRALSRLLAEPPPIQLTPVIVAAMKEISARMPFPASLELAHLEWPYMTRLALRGPLEAYTVQALMRNTISLTVLKSGFKANVIPATAQAEIDVRLLPGVDENAFLRRIKDKLRDPRIAIEFIQRPDDAPPSPIKGEAIDAIRKLVAENFPDSYVIPWMTAGGTDSRFLRARGVPAYGFEPIIVPSGDSIRVHGVDERLSIENLNRGVRATYKLALELCGPSK
jgi:acetylornithine deacetylase/succinyl-diaminopimelate desuccinylase-like protein